MSATTIPEAELDQSAATPTTTPAARALRALAFRNIGAVYVWLVFIVVFTVWTPSIFPTWSTVQQIANESAPTALMTLAVIIPLCAATFDLSIGWVAALTAVLSSYLVSHGVPVAPAVAITVAAAATVGLVNATVVVGMSVDSFIATLATGSLVQSVITLVTDDIPINDPALSGPFAKIGQEQVVAGLTLPVFYMLALAVVLWFLLEHTATGRRLYATGFNAESARLAGVKTARLRFWSLIVSATVAGFAGIVLASTLGAGDPGVGNPYLLSAYAAAFLGATQLRPGRFNAWGALIGVVLLQTGTVGLGLAVAPRWTPAMFTGVVLIAALTITGTKQHAAKGRSWKQLFRRPSAILSPPRSPTEQEQST